MSLPSPLLHAVLACLLGQAHPPAQDPAGAPVAAELRTHLEHAGVPLEGSTRAKLMITRGASVLWSHDGTGSHERQPEGALVVELDAGELRLELGRAPMQALPEALLADPSGAVLHLWVEVDGRFLRAPHPLPLAHDEGGAGGSPDALVRAARVVDAKVERKSRRLESGQGKRPESPDERLRYRRRMRLDERGEIAPDALLRARRHLDALPELKPGAGLTKDANLWSWSWLGPGNVGGRIRAILTHPSQPNTLWIGSVGGGIWKTTDGGASWSPADDFMASLAVTSLAMKPGNPSVLYAATGEGFGNFDALPGAGVFKSTDGGATWSHLAATDPASNPAWQWVNRLATNPSQPTWLFAITSDGRLWRSEDEGASFTAVLSTLQAGLDVKVHQNQVYFMAVGTNRGVWTSSNYGSPGSWTFQSTGAAQKLPFGAGRAELALNAGTPITLYAGLDRNQGEIWRSQDAGVTWTQQSTGLAYMATQGWYDNTIWVDPTNAARIVVGGIDLWRSTDGGVSLSKISAWNQYHLGNSAHGDQHAIVPHPLYNGTTNKTVYFGNDGGIQRASDVWGVSQTSGWTNLANGLGITQFYGGATAPDGSVLIGGTQDNDTLRYTPAGGAGGWYQAHTGDGGSCAVDWITPSTMYAEYQFLVPKKSTNGGASYANATSGLTDSDDCCRTMFIAPMEMDPNDPARLIAGGISIWRTTNKAASWSSIRAPITHSGWSANKCGGTCSTTSNPACTAIAVAKGNSNVIWVGYESGRVSRSLDGGASWANVDAALPFWRVATSIAIHPYDSNQVLVTFGGNQQQSIWYTADGGGTWADRTGVAPHDLPPIQLNTVTFNPAQPNWVYVGTDLGVLASEDLGVTWSKLPLVPGAGTEGPVNTEVADLFWQGGSSLIAATHGRGMYRATPFQAIYVDKLFTGTQKGTFEQPFTTVAAAKAAAFPGTTIVIKGETYLEAPLVFDQSGALHAVGGVVILR